jgi:AraC-like DNA-binding protein
LGPNAYRYDPEQYLVVSVDVPVTSQVVDASPSRPYLCMVLDLDPSTLGSMLLESGTSAEDRVPPPGMMVSRLTPELRDAAIRLISLLDAPRDLAALAPLAEREILYRLLTGEQGVMLRQIALGDSKLRRVARAIDWIRRHFREPFRIEKLAAEAAMSPSALHAHFKTVTAMSPLQYQKQLRLQEARLLMMGNAMDAARAAYEVGYESPSQFSREYRRLFGNPPARDIARLKQAPVAAGA